MTSTFNYLALAFYSLAFFLTYSVLKKRMLGESGNKVKAILMAAWSVGLILHGLGLYQEIWLHGIINLAFFNVLSIITLLISMLLYFSYFKQPVEHLLIVVLPSTILSIILAITPGATDTISEPVESFIQFHILTSLLAYSVLSLAALQAILLFFQDYQLHHRHPGGLVRALPSLQWMEDWLFRMITLGFLLLSVALASGFIFIQDMFLQHLIHKTVLSLFAWSIFATLLWGRWRFGWRGRTAINWALGGYVFLMLAYLGTKVVLELILHRI